MHQVDLRDRVAYAEFLENFAYKYKITPKNFQEIKDIYYVEKDGPSLFGDTHPEKVFAFFRSLFDGLAYDKMVQEFLTLNPSLEGFITSETTGIRACYVSYEKELSRFNTFYDLCAFGIAPDKFQRFLTKYTLSDPEVTRDISLVHFGVHENVPPYFGKLSAGSPPAYIINQAEVNDNFGFCPFKAVAFAHAGDKSEKDFQDFRNRQKALRNDELYLVDLSTFVRQKFGLNIRFCALI